MVYRPTNQSKLRQLKLAVAAATSLAASGPSSKTPEIAPQAPGNSVPLASMEQSPASCFLEAFGYNAENITPDRADSTVYILNRIDKTSMSPEALIKASTGTGFVVADSFGADGWNRIVTEQHVTNIYDDKGGARDGKGGFLIYKSNGHFLGTAAVVASGGYYEPHRTLVDDEKRGLKDAAVLAMTSFASPAAEREYKAIAGFPIARQQSTDLLKLSIKDGTAVPAPGASGAPTFDNAGRVVGIYHSVLPKADGLQDADVAHSLSYGNIFDAIVNNQEFRPTMGKMFDASVGDGFVVPLGNKKIDAALNAAGKSITSARLTSTLSVTITAFPLSECSTYQAIAQADPYVPPAGSSHHKKHSKPQAPLRR